MLVTYSRLVLTYTLFVLHDVTITVILRVFLLFLIFLYDPLFEADLILTGYTIKITYKNIKISIIAALVMLTLALPLANATSTETGEIYTLYPCSNCHSKITVTGNTHWSYFHDVNLTAGAHSGLMCSNCHDPQSNMMNLVNGVPIALIGLHNQSQLMEVNTLCGICHTKEFEAYNLGAHGNVTYECINGTYIDVKGYNGVTYRLHLCDNYYNLTTKPANPCVTCHNPHEPTYYALSVLPPPSDRVPPPDETNILIGGISVVITGLSLIFAGHLIASRSPRR